jgi:predicted O-linked N-acetylglucosamine transferase (SPINDLY family)
VDYYLSSDLVEPVAAESHYSETLIRAPTLLAYQTPVQEPRPGKTREDFGFSRRQNLYLCPQHLGKFHPDFDPLLGEILRGDPRGIVVVTEDRYGYGARKLEERLRRTIPDVASRVLLIPRRNLPDYLNLVGAADVLLDPPHFAGVNTTYDALALDQPIVTWPSGFHRGRYTYGCYRKMGLLDCIATSAADYVRIALELACDSDHRETVRQRIRQRKHRLFHDEGAVAEHARIFREVVNRARGQ